MEPIHNAPLYEKNILSPRTHPHIIRANRRCGGCSRDDTGMRLYE